jgi:hypothetical protein
MFQLTWEEAKELPRSRSQIVILKRGRNIKHLPYTFTEHGAIMAATILNSPQAVQMSVFVVRAFVRMQQMLAMSNEMASKLAELERRMAGTRGYLQSDAFFREVLGVDCETAYRLAQHFSQGEPKELKDISGMTDDLANRVRYLTAGGLE